jgi:4'-phosphopantetheinyl transferase EntD
MWPPGVIGSITHTDEHAAAVVMTANAARSIGIDLESLAHAARTPDLLSMVATAAERASHVDPRHLAALLFSAKESVYKCVYPLTGQFLDFHDVELAIDDNAGFTARAKGYDVRGRFAVDSEHVATVATI